MYVYILTMGQSADAMNFIGAYKLYGDAKAEALAMADETGKYADTPFKRTVDNHLRFELRNADTEIRVEREPLF